MDNFDIVIGRIAASSSSYWGRQLYSPILRQLRPGTPAQRIIAFDALANRWWIEEMLEVR